MEHRLTTEHLSIGYDPVKPSFALFNNRDEVAIEFKERDAREIRAVLDRVLNNYDKNKAT